MTSTNINLTKFFKDGIHFACQKCGQCCRGFNSGEVFLYKEDIIRLVNFMNQELDQDITLTSFCEKYVKLIGTSFYWKPKGASRGRNYSFKTLGFRFVGEDEHCPLLSEENLCTVHKARPFQCRAYPIGWNMLITSVRNFRKYTRECPGLEKSLKNEGNYYTSEEITQWAHREYKIEKNFFLKMKEHDFDIFKVFPFLPKDLCKNSKRY